ncbi:MAG: DUF4382 domain-containing protein [Reichenbachiella sp.]|uniref:DUF4382 domain-containing protein n=2 Tax=Reichenbachiella sp. TaxID=2184521 RepID=UPI00326673E3
MKLMITNNKLYLIALIAYTALFANCSNDDKGSAKIQVSLVDAPADYDAVMIDIRDIQINVSSDASDENGWQSLEGAQPGVYDLLLLTNGEEAFLGEIELPEGQLGQVRLILGDGNKLTIDGQETVLTVPSGSESGLKLNVNADIQAGITYKLVIDFDAAKSVVMAGNSGKYNLKPVIRALMEATTGAIHGTISPASTAAVVYAIAGEDSVSSYPDETGEFLIRALDAGTYTVSSVPDEASGLSAATMENIAVTVGETTEAGVLEMK